MNDAEKILEAYKEANNTIYLNDSSYYIKALYEICIILCPSINLENVGTNFIE